MKQDAGFFESREAILIYVARRLRDALRLESLLGAAGIDYGVEADFYTGGVIFRRQRAGAFFYVLPDAADSARRTMRENGYVPFEEAV